MSSVARFLSIRHNEYEMCSGHMEDEQYYTTTDFCMVSFAFLSNVVSYMFSFFELCDNCVVHKYKC